MFLSRLSSTLKRKGLIPTLQLLCSKATQLSRLVNTSYYHKYRQKQISELEFDKKWGVDTRGIDYPKIGKIAGSNWISGNRYEAVNPDIFMNMINSISIPFDETIFLDYGCGKGRAVILACQFPFKKIIGIEYCKEYIQTAEKNVANISTNSKKCNDIELVWGDAIDFNLPTMPLVLFFYNPFDRTVMKQIVSRVEASFRENPRKFVVIYLTPEFADLWDELPFLERAMPGKSIWLTRN